MLLHKCEAANWEPDPDGSNQISGYGEIWNRLSWENIECSSFLTFLTINIPWQGTKRVFWKFTHSKDKALKRDRGSRFQTCSYREKRVWMSRKIFLDLLLEILVCGESVARNKTIGFLKQHSPVFSMLLTETLVEQSSWCFSRNLCLNVEINQI